MHKLRNVLPFYKQKEEKNYSCENGSSLLKDLIACFGARNELLIRCFTAGELITATNNFSENVEQVSVDGEEFFKGNLRGRPILVKRCVPRNVWSSPTHHSIRDIVVNSQMSHLKNVLHLTGCCLEFERPALVYDYAPGTDSLYHCLRNPCDGKLLSWKSRIKIASDIANVLLYLHTAFPTPIIFRDLQTRTVILDNSGVAKLFNFGLSISLPHGEKKVEDVPTGTLGYLDPEYFMSGFVTEKADVYSLGILILVLITGEADLWYRDEPIRTCVKDCLENGPFKHIVDPKSFEEEGYNEHEIEQHLLPFANLSLRCTEEKGEDRPDMIDVAKQLHQIEKSVRNY